MLELPWEINTHVRIRDIDRFTPPRKEGNRDEEQRDRRNLRKSQPANSFPIQFKMGRSLDRSNCFYETTALGAHYAMENGQRLSAIGQK